MGAHMEDQNQSRPFRRIEVCIPNVNNKRQDVIVLLALDLQINIKPWSPYFGWSKSRDRDAPQKLEFNTIYHYRWGNIDIIQFFPSSHAQLINRPFRYSGTIGEEPIK